MAAARRAVHCSNVATVIVGIFARYGARIATLHLTGHDLLADLTGPVEPAIAGQLVVVDPPSPRASAALLEQASDRLATLPCVVATTHDWELADVVLAGGDSHGGGRDRPGGGGDRPGGGRDGLVTGTGLEGRGHHGDETGDLADIESTFEAAPIASTALALHLRASNRRSPFDGLVAESTLFSALQAGPEHGAWRASHQRRDRLDAGPPVQVERDGSELWITLNRPEVRNAVSAALRDELLAALAVAEGAPDLEVHIRGTGPDFCAGGDLDEFGTTPDPATAHLIRTRRSLAAALHRIAPRTTVHLHGAVFGAGIELAAFAGTVVAAADVRIGLPELGLGLVPGAGGTVSLPMRIGRQRTAWLALTRRTIDGPTAHRWGLVDQIT